MNRYGLALVAAALLLAACGGKQTMASRSAAAYREAQAKGIPVSGGPEHGHEAGGAATTSTASEMDHSTMEHAAMEHAAMDHSAMDHSTMDHGAMDHGAMDHGSMDPATADHSAHAGHTMPPTSNAEMARTTPGATLQPDVFDAPAPSAVAESQKAAGVKKEQ